VPAAATAPIASRPSAILERIEVVMVDSFPDACSLRRTP
jgi:hypothetical protein